MAKHNEVGKRGEELAVAYLKKNGFEILHRNFTFKKNEIDIIAMFKDVLHFVEVKTLNGLEYPEAAVTKKKFREICKVADEFLFRFPEYSKIQFDIMAINLHDGKEIYFFIEDIYF